jgi:hypothetical protein
MSGCGTAERDIYIHTCTLYINIHTHIVAEVDLEGADVGVRHGRTCSRFPKRIEVGRVRGWEEDKPIGSLVSGSSRFSQWQI